MDRPPGSRSRAFWLAVTLVLLVAVIPCGLAFSIITTKHACDRLHMNVLLPVYVTTMLLWMATSAAHKARNKGAHSLNGMLKILYWVTGAGMAVSIGLLIVLIIDLLSEAPGP